MTIKYSNIICLVSLLILTLTNAEKQLNLEDIERDMLISEKKAQVEQTKNKYYSQFETSSPKQFLVPSEQTKNQYYSQFETSSPKQFLVPSEQTKNQYYSQFETSSPKQFLIPSQQTKNQYYSQFVETSSPKQYLVPSEQTKNQYYSQFVETSSPKQYLSSNKQILPSYVQASPSQLTSKQLAQYINENHIASPYLHKKPIYPLKPLSTKIYPSKNKFQTKNIAQNYLAAQSHLASGLKQNFQLNPINYQNAFIKPNHPFLINHLAQYNQQYYPSIHPQSINHPQTSQINQQSDNLQIPQPSQQSQIINHSNLFNQPQIAQPQIVNQPQYFTYDQQQINYSPIAHQLIHPQIAQTQIVHPQLNQIRSQIVHPPLANQQAIYQKLYNQVPVTVNSQLGGEQVAKPELVNPSQSTLQQYDVQKSIEQYDRPINQNVKSNLASPVEQQYQTFETEPNSNYLTAEQTNPNLLYIQPQYFVMQQMKINGVPYIMLLPQDATTSSSYLSTNLHNFVQAYQPKQEISSQENTQVNQDDYSQIVVEDPKANNEEEIKNNRPKEVEVEVLDEVTPKNPFIFSSSPRSLLESYIPSKVQIEYMKYMQQRSEKDKNKRIKFKSNQKNKYDAPVERQQQNYSELSETKSNQKYHKTALEQPSNQENYPEIIGTSSVNYQINHTI